MTEREGKGKRLLDRWWVQVLVAVWVLAIITIYFRLQIMRLLEMGGMGR